MRVAPWRRVLVRLSTILGVLATLAGLLWVIARVVGLTVIRVDRTTIEPIRSAAVLQASVELAEADGVDDPAFEATMAVPRNVILFIADGLGFSHLALARAAHHGVDGAAVWDRFPVTGWHRASPAGGYLTDSAASATALATGVPTTNGAIGVDAEGQARKTLFEHATELGYRTGIVTDSYVWDATPAAFVTHVASRDHAGEILRQLGETSLDVLFGELEDVGEEEVPEWDASIELLKRRFEVLGPAPVRRDELLAPPPGTPLAAIFVEDQVTDLESAPTLPMLVGAALDRLAAAPFVLLVESEESDSASHAMDLDRLLRGLQAIEATLELVLDFAEQHGDTLVVFTSDHETGGLAVSVTDSSNRHLRALWSSSTHTGVPVPVMAMGPGAEQFAGSRANWQLGRLLTGVLGSSELGDGLERQRAMYNSREGG